MDAPAEAVWAIVSDPRRLPRWWPEIERVEDATPEAWTTVHSTRRGKTIRADFTRLEAVAPSTLAWRQEVEESPFERFMRSSETRVALSPVDSGERTRVEIRERARLRGLALLGAPMFRRATRRRLDRALASLAEAVAGARGS
jgi:uncharacterized protein YndB with AHSA1/START domain